MMEEIVKAQFSFLLAQTPGDLFIKNRDGVYLAASESFAKKAGFSSATAMVGKTDQDCAWKEYAHTFLKHDQQVMHSGQREIFYESALVASGDIALLKTEKSPVRDNHGQMFGVMGLSVCLTEVDEAYQVLFTRLQEKEALHQAEVQYLIEWYQFISGEQCPSTMTCQQIGHKIRHYMEFMLNQVPVGISWMDKSGNVLGYNEPLKSLWSRQTHARGLSLKEILPVTVASEILDNNARALAQDATLLFEERIRLGDAPERIFLSYKTPIRDDECATIGLMNVAVDITERKRMEEDLRVAKEKAEEAHNAKIQFLKNMRHDVRTPLSCITGCVKILKKMEQDPEKLEFLEGALHSSENLLQMLTKMLEVDHIQSNERPLQYQVFSLHLLMRELVEMFAFTARQKGLDLRYEVMDDVPEDLVTDYYRFQRVMLNLVNNAIKFTHEGYISIRLTMDGPHTLCCAISDTGIGIEESKKDVIFQKHVRLVEADQGQYPGEGIGLSIVKQFVEDLGGTIALESKLNHGSTFIVRLNLENASQHEVSQQERLHEGVVS